MKTNFANYCNPRLDRYKNISANGKRKLSYTFFLSILLALAFGNAAFAQKPASCGSVNCTSNDVRIVRAYLSGPNSAAIDCGSSKPFDNAELHLVVSSNTKRIGVSISTTLVYGPGPDDHYYVGKCYGETLNNGSNNDLVYSLGNALSNVQCGTSFSLTDVFTSWGTGNTNFCTGTGAQCPATPAKCRFQEGEIIKVDVKLDIDFTFVVGDCAKGQDGLTVAFTPSITAQGINKPLTVDWDFGDGNTKEFSDITDIVDAASSHSYAKSGTYTVTLTVTDATSPTPVMKSTRYEVTVASCCTLSAPMLTVGPFCYADGKKVADLPQSVSNGSGGSYTYHWYDGPDPETSFELDPTTVIKDGDVYYASVSDGSCESGRTKVTIAVLPTPTVSSLNGPTGSICTGSSATITVKGTPNTTVSYSVGNTTGTVNLDNNGDGSFSTGDLTATTTYILAGIVYTNNSPGCAASASGSVTVTVDPASAATISLTGSADACSGNNTGTISVTSKVGNILRWESSTDNITYATYASAGTSSSFNFTNLITTTWFRVVVQSGSCPEANSNAIKITVGTCVTSFTQGFWGGTSGNGTDCNGTTLKTILAGLLPVKVGSATKYLNLNDVAKTQKILPGGSYSLNVFDKAYALNAVAPETALSGTKYVDSKTGKLVSVVISQTIALTLNIKYNADLGQIAFMSGKNVLNTKPLSYSTKCTVAATGSTATYPMSPKVLCYLEQKELPNTTTKAYTFDVKGLVQLANDVIGGVVTLSNTGVPFSFSELVQTLDAVNRGFDKGALLIGYTGAYTCTSTVYQNVRGNVDLTGYATVEALSVAAYPNPFTNKIRFTIKAPKAGRATLEVYNMLGQKMGVPFEGVLNANETRNVEYNAPLNSRTNLIYMLRMNGQQVSGKLISTKQ